MYCAPGTLLRTVMQRKKQCSFPLGTHTLMVNVGLQTNTELSVRNMTVVAQRMKYSHMEKELHRKYDKWTRI